MLEVLFRWIHVLTAVVLVGGAFYSRFVLVPIAQNLPESERTSLMDQARQRWKRVVMIGIALLLISGFYNYLVVTAPAHKGQGLYHGLMGGKILLALAVFFLASALTGRSAKLAAIRQSPRKWLTALLLLAFAIIMIAGYLKVAVPGAPVAL